MFPPWHTGSERTEKVCVTTLPLVITTEIRHRSQMAHLEMEGSSSASFTASLTLSMHGRPVWDAARGGPKKIRDKQLWKNMPFIYVPFLIRSDIEDLKQVCISFYSFEFFQSEKRGNRSKKEIPWNMCSASTKPEGLLMRISITPFFPLPPKVCIWGFHSESPNTQRWRVSKYARHTHQFSNSYRPMNSKLIYSLFASIRIWNHKPENKESEKSYIPL